MDPNAPTLDLMSARQLLTAVRGRLAVETYRAQLGAAVMGAEPPDPLETFGLGSSGPPSAASVTADLKARRPHWFTPDPATA